MGTSSFQIYILHPFEISIKFYNITNTNFTEVEDATRVETPSQFLPFLPRDEGRDSASDPQVDRNSRSDKAGQHN